MIQKSIFQKRINQPTRKNISTDQNPKNQTQTKQYFKDLSNVLLSSQNFNTIDYKSFYEHEKNITAQLIQKIQLLQQKIKLLQQQNKDLKKKLKQCNQIQRNQSSLNYISLNKKSHKQIFQQIHSFKVNLPNSMKLIQFEELDNFQSVNFLTDQQIMSKYDVNDNKQNDYNRQLNEQRSMKNYNQQKSIAKSSVTIKLINDESLIDCLAMYGLSQELKFDEQEQDYFLEGELSYCSKTPHQIIKHSSKLIYPDKINKQDIKYYADEQAVENAVSLVSQTLKSQEIKAFTLIFEPAIMPNKEQQEQQDQFQWKNQSQIINLINKQRRFYAICVPFLDFDIVDKTSTNYFPDISFQNSIQQVIFADNVNSINYQQKEKQIQIKLSKQNGFTQKDQQISQNQSNYNIRISRKVITFFTKYPFIQFFEQLLIHCLKQSFQSRKNQMKKNLSQLKNFDHRKSIDFIKIFYQNLNQQFQLNKKFKSKLNQIFQIKFFSSRFTRFQTLSLQLSKTLLKSYYSQIWAYSVLKLFNLDNFLQIFTLIMLQEKIIFVSENQHILTSAIFLFTKVLMRPFQYPYPVVSIIPNQYDYFNAPFPIVYGCLNSKENLIRQKIPKIYKNFYIILSPNGIQILNHKNASKIQSRKSPKLRDKLLPCFIKMQNQQKQQNQQKINNPPRFSGLSSLLGLNSSNNSNQSQVSKKNKFNFSNNNRQLSHQIIQKVFHYLNGIKDKLPSRNQVKQMKQIIKNEIKLKNPSEAKNIDLDKETYERYKNKLINKTKDPFVQKFIQTQIVGMEILK